MQKPLPGALLQEGGGKPWLAAVSQDWTLLRVCAEQLRVWPGLSLPRLSLQPELELLSPARLSLPGLTVNLDILSKPFRPVLW